ncbi:D-amino-acid transaminase [Thioalkalivibrio sp. HK1]|uniref:D-amino-acid transaminase n=1 Tax=Thioalkalivibrio sp. HK1 TaxID=1469245 RepID=UPI00046EF3FA|nr:D-amino-acid transaminase [Thioalkalivibrio sp. HK1]
MSNAIPPGITYVNDRFLEASEATVSIFDRGFLFADAIYEVSSVLEGGLVDNPAHLARLQRSLGEVDLPLPLAPEKITGLQRELIERNRLHEGLVYLQITRGPANRDFAFPSSPQPTLVMFVQHKKIVDNPAAKSGISIITSPDLRWARCDIKSVSLLAASMAKQAALDAGADDTWMVENDRITEGSSNNAWIVGSEGNLITRHLGSEILPGITRSVVLRLAQEEGLEVEERAFTVAEAKSAAEAFSTSAASFVVPVVRIDDRVIGDGKPGPLTREIRKRYIKSAMESARSDIDEARSNSQESR